MSAKLLPTVGKSVKQINWNGVVVEKPYSHLLPANSLHLVKENIYMVHKDYIAFKQ